MKKRSWSEVEIYNGGNLWWMRRLELGRDGRREREREREAARRRARWLTQSARLIFKVADLQAISSTLLHQLLFHSDSL